MVIYKSSPLDSAGMGSRLSGAKAPFLPWVDESDTDAEVNLWFAGSQCHKYAYAVLKAQSSISVCLYIRVHSPNDSGLVIVILIQLFNISV